MSSLATFGSRFSSETSRRVIRRTIRLRSTPSWSALSINRRISSAAEPRRRVGVRGGRDDDISRIREEAVFAADAHLARTTLILEGAGALVGGGLGLFLFGGVIGELALVLDRPTAF